MDTIKWITGWYKSNCDGDWEHLFGIKISGLGGRMGWLVQIDLDDTALEEKSFDDIRYKAKDNDWIDCTVEHTISGCKFIGKGDTDKLEEILKIFKNWSMESK